MSLDLFLLCLVVGFAVMGAYTGAAKQIAYLVAIGAGYACARPLGTALGPYLGSAFGLPLVLAVVLATFLVFVVGVMVVRHLLTVLLQRVISGGAPEDRSIDRALGFVFGGAKVAVFAYVVLCALAFVESNITLAGKQLGVSPKDSRAFQLAKKHNLFQLSQFAQVENLAKLASARSDPKRMGSLKNDPAYKALSKDPRFLKAVDDSALRDALKKGDYQAALRSSAVLQLVQDPTWAARLEAAAEASERK